MICPKCGSANSEGSTFCISCGTDLHPAEAQPPPPPGMGAPPPQWGTPPPPPPGGPPPPQPPPQYAPPPPPGYGAPQYAPYGTAPGYAGYYAPVQTTNALAIVSLILGIVWVCGLGSIAALITGYIAKSNIDKSGGREGGRGLALAGIILGWIGVVALIGWIVLLIVAGSIDNSNA